MSNIGFATVSIVPSARGFQGSLDRQINSPLARSGALGGKKFGTGMLGGMAPMMKSAGLLGAALGLGAIAKDAIGLEATFSQTMNTMAAVANVPASGIKELSALAMKMGADTTFSASEAADGMLELAKGGLSAATIKGGALAGTMTLAAAGGTDLATAATIASNALNTFSLKGSDMAAVSAAIAGGANASSASVESLGDGLAQVGAGATNAGLSIQETIAALSLLDAAGTKGSDGGTSLKTMLTSLTPATKKARKEMSSLELDFVDSKGSFVSLANMAEQLKTKLGGLSEAERAASLETMFGSDGTRAATALMKEGAAGVGVYMKATNDLGAAQRVAESRMKGTAGAIERMKGSAETAKLALGKVMAPATAAGADLLAEGFNGVADGIGKAVPNLTSFFSQAGSGSGLMTSLTATFGSLKTFAGSLVGPLKEVGASIMGALGPGLATVSATLSGTFLPAFRAILPILAPIAGFIIRTLGGAIVGVIKGAFSIINGVLQLIGGIFKIIASAVKGDWSGMWNGIVTVAKGVMNIIKGAISVWWNIGILGAFKRLALGALGSFKGLWSSLKGAASSGMAAVKAFFLNGLKAIGSGVKSAVLGYFGIWKSLFSILKSVAINGWKVLRSAFGGAMAAIRSVISGAMSAIRGAFSSAFSSIKSTVSGAINSVISTVKGLPGRAVSALGNIGGRLVSAGGDLIRGFIRGITSAAGGIISAIRGAITDKLPDFVKQKLIIRSPSRVFMKIGGNVSEGMALGISRSAGLVTKAADGMVAIPDARAGASRYGAAGGSSPLVGSLTVESRGNAKADLEEALFQLRRIQRGGVYA